MEILILYWGFSVFWCIGFDTYKSDNTFTNLVISLLFGWYLLPMSYGSKRAKELDN